MRKVKHLLTAALLTVSISSHAEFLSGNVLLSHMFSSENDNFFALGYVTGVADATMGKYWCPKGEISAREVFDLTKGLLIDAPDRRDLSADIFVVTALKRALPCPKTKPKGSKAV